MPIITFNVHFSEDETLPERLEQFAQFNEVPVELVVRRAISKYIGFFGLTEPQKGFKGTNLQELFVAMGLSKPLQAGAPVKGDASHEPPQGSLDQ